MPAIGATPSLPRVSTKAPFTIPFADLAHRILLVLPTGGFFEFKTYALAGRLRARAKAWLPDRSAPPTRTELAFATSRAVLELERNQPAARRIVGQISPNASIVSSTDTPSPANGRMMISGTRQKTPASQNFHVPPFSA